VPERVRLHGRARAQTKGAVGSLVKEPVRSQEQRGKVCPWPRPADFFSPQAGTTNSPRLIFVCREQGQLRIGQ